MNGVEVKRFEWLIEEMGYSLEEAKLILEFDSFFID